jgi:hypothetical protein
MSNVLAFIGCLAVVAAILIEIVRNFKEICLFVISVIIFVGVLVYLVWSISVGLHWFFN